jgi:hypothetical protein
MILAPQTIYYHPANVPSNSLCSPQIFPTHVNYSSSRLIVLPISSIRPSSFLIILPALSVVLSSLFYYWTYSFIESLDDSDNYENTSDSESSFNIKKGSNQGDTSTDSNQGLFYKKAPRRLERNNKLLNIKSDPLVLGTPLYSASRLTHRSNIYYLQYF